MKKVNYREFNEAKVEANEKLRVLSNELLNEDGWNKNIELHEKATWGREDAPIEMQVNWAAIGSVDTDKAMAFSILIQKACEMAKNFKYNGYILEY